MYDIDFTSANITEITQAVSAQTCTYLEFEPSFSYAVTERDFISSKPNLMFCKIYWNIHNWEG